jgi:hypothetical protein
MLCAMFPSMAPRIVTTALAPGRSEHARQRDLVRASLLLKPPASSGTHRRRG